MNTRHISDVHIYVQVNIHENKTKINTFFKVEQFWGGGNRKNGNGMAKKM